MSIDELRAWAKAHAPRMPQAAAVLRLLDGFDYIGGVSA